jgi:transposase
MDTVDSAITKPVRRLEVFTGAGRRRTWSDEEKARVVAEIETSGDSVSGVARRHGLSLQQLFGWRRQVREAQALVSKDDEQRFVPAVVDAAPPDTAGHRQRKT